MPSTSNYRTLDGTINNEARSYDNPAKQNRHNIQRHIKNKVKLQADKVIYEAICL